ncbi:FKBP-type peptidyl-prolyl cis-trans isomerase [Nocardioides sp. MH1]|uniref:FKBP-type peptidyl-prolyl cis-trans isomerase n=1 Tax=Nocardioides sp. MH1 TaxID=3242490 RepID=UPI00351FC2B2
MLSRLTRPAALASVALCSLALLTACGDDASSGVKEASGFDAVSISGPVGEEPTFDWKAALKPGDTQDEVLEEGDGTALKDGDQLLVNFAVSDDFSRDVSYSTYGDDTGASVLTVGTDVEPQQAQDLITQLIEEHVKSGMKTGTRLAFTVDVKKEWGDTGLYLTGIDVGNEDGIAVVADLEAVPLDGPKGKSKAAPSWAPKIEQEKGDLTGLDSSAEAAPDAKATDLTKAILVEGTGPTVEKGDEIIANYIGQVYDADKPFDLSYDDKSPASFTIGTGAVVKGWDEGLVGVKVGSRVLLRIPPKLGYGKQGNSQAGIKGTDTLYFVIDVLATA